MILEGNWCKFYTQNLPKIGHIFEFKKNQICPKSVKSWYLFVTFHRICVWFLYSYLADIRRIYEIHIMKKDHPCQIFVHFPCFFPKKLQQPAKIWCFFTQFQRFCTFKITICHMTHGVHHFPNPIFWNLTRLNQKELWFYSYGLYSNKNSTSLISLYDRF